MGLLAKVISGGQSGVDRAALRAAKAAGIPTGGWAAKGWATEAGPRPKLAEWGLRECPEAGYSARTRRNVNTAHATLVLADVDDHTKLTGGTRLTWEAMCEAGPRGAGGYLADVRSLAMVADCVAWLKECVGDRADFVLNVAGPRESKSPGIGERAEAFLAEVFAAVADGEGRGS
jgi:hypothetical protein